MNYKYVNVVAAAPTTTIVRSSPGKLHNVTINKAAANGVITMYNSPSATSTDIIGIITMPATLLANQVTLNYDVDFSKGLTVVTSGAAQDITFSVSDQTN